MDDGLGGCQLAGWLTGWLVEAMIKFVPPFSGLFNAQLVRETSEVQKDDYIIRLNFKALLQQGQQQVWEIALDGPTTLEK